MNSSHKKVPPLWVEFIILLPYNWEFSKLFLTQLAIFRYELKMDVGPGYRLYFGRESDLVLILLCGGTKKSQQKDIEKAKKLWQDFTRRRK
jgi:hypothetical protein